MSEEHAVHRIPCADVRQLLAAPDAVVIDLRSPSEYAEDHVPGARSVPLLDDAERALVGTLYKRASRDEAFAEGRRAVVERVTGLVSEIAVAAGWDVPADDLAARVESMTAGGIDALERALEAEPVGALPERPVVLHCWRGGLRSRSVVALMRALGLTRAHGLVGGYKAYRRAVMDDLEGWEAPPCAVLRGLTGVGKTLVLSELERIRPGWTLDLEAAAQHRSSILGMVGRTPVTQRTFETRLAARLRAGFTGPVVMEGESRKVGDSILPKRVWDVLCGGTSFELVAPTEVRVRVLMDDYLAGEGSTDELRAQLPFIEERLGPVKWKGVLVGLLDAGRMEELVEQLLEYYYDPLYRHSEREYAYAATIDSSDPARAAAEVAELLDLHTVS
jgi:tRNA 2-selenouridine synthase